MGPLLQGLFRAQQTARMAWLFRGMCAHHALTLISNHFDIPFEDVHRRFWHQSEEALEESLRLLDTPDGWTVLGEQMAQASGASADIPIFKPTIH